MQSHFHDQPAPFAVPNTWEAKVSAKRAMARQAIPKEWFLSEEILATLQHPLEEHSNRLMALDIPRRSGILTGLEIEITEVYDTASLLEKLASGELSAVDVTRAFSKRAAIAQQMTNCLTETFFDQAYKRAKELDALRATGKVAGPLHGLPISVKDGFQVTGTQATVGLCAFLDSYSDRNSSLIDVILSLGAVPYVKTNIPQSMMTADSHNNIFGRVLNPWNTMLGAGGSSGGEGALVAFRGSPLGIGTDIAGSIRIPAICCGTYGFRPTANRVPCSGQRVCSDRGKKFVDSCAGPLANDIDTLEIFMKAVISARPARYDSGILDIPWRSIPREPAQKLRLGVVHEDPCFPLHPVIHRSISDAVSKLEACGHTLMRLTPEDCHINEMDEVIWGLFDFDDTASMLVREAGEPPVPSRVRIQNERKRRIGTCMPGLSSATQFDRLAILIRKRAQLSESWYRLLRQHDFDAIIAPGAQNTAVEHDLFGLPPYTSFINLLDYPACVIPLGPAKPMPEDHFDINNGQMGPPYRPGLMDGMPCSLQVVTYWMRDEECLSIAKIIDDCLK